MRSHRARLLLGAWALLQGIDCLAQGISLANIPTTGVLRAERTSAPIHIALYSRDPAALAALMQIDRHTVKADRVDIRLGAYAPLEVIGARTWLEPTFVIDFKERETSDMYEALIAAKSATPTPADLVDFVSDSMHGAYGRSWDVASIVARNRQGDCTEYAVLLTALSRAAGRPARVILGAVIVETAAGPVTYGHAWSELQVDGRWAVADAALVGAKIVGYIPLGVLTDEGPGFITSLARPLQTWIHRVEILASSTR